MDNRMPMSCGPVFAWDYQGSPDVHARVNIDRSVSNL
jgi:hypothetical protein